MAHTYPSAQDVARHLARADSALGRVVRAVTEARQGPLSIPPSAVSTHFEALARAIVFQQLSGKAASTIYGRFRALLPEDERPTPSAVARLPTDALRSAGLSAAKARYVLALAECVESGALVLDGIEDEPDDEVVSRLVVVPGIGQWSAQMFLMFHLGRPDVLASGDLGVRKGLALALGLEAPPPPPMVDATGAAWGPYRTYACLYLWASLELSAEARACLIAAAAPLRD